MKTYSYDEFKKASSDLFHLSISANLGSLQSAYEAVKEIYNNISPKPQGTMSIVATSSWRFVEQEYNKMAVRAILKQSSN